MDRRGRERYFEAIVREVGRSWHLEDALYRFDYSTTRDSVIMGSTGKPNSGLKKWISGKRTSILRRKRTREISAADHPRCRTRYD